MTRERGERGELVWNRGEGIWAVRCATSVLLASHQFVKAFLKRKSEKERMRYAICTTSEWATKKERKNEGKQRWRNASKTFFFFFTAVPHNQQTNPTEMLHRCQDLCSSGVFRLSGHVTWYLVERRNCTCAHHTWTGGWEWRCSSIYPVSALGGRECLTSHPGP